MNNQQIINKRWLKTEKAFRKYLKDIRKLYFGVGDEVVNLIKIVKPEYSKLNKIVPDDVKRFTKKKVKEWTEQGIVTGYFAYLVLSLTRYTYQNVLELLIYGTYVSMDRKLYEVDKKIFKESIQDLYDQGRKELKEDPKELRWVEMLAFLMIPALNETYENYQKAVNITAAQEMLQQIISMLRSEIIINGDNLESLITKQIHRILKVNHDKYSGTVVDTARSAGNLAYASASEKDQLVRFVAEMDDRTTKMCRSLDGQIFHTKEWNIFERYSEFYKGIHKFSCKGLQVGLNLPPINDHFHWCRSTITYQVDTA